MPLATALLLVLPRHASGILSYELNGQVCYRVRRNKRCEIRKNGMIDYPSTHGECLPIQDVSKRGFHGFGYKNCEVVGDAPALGTSDGFNWQSEVGANRDICLQCCSHS